MFVILEYTVVSEELMYNMRDGIVLYISDCYLYYREYVWIELNNCSYLLFVSF